MAASVERCRLDAIQPGSESEYLSEPRVFLTFEENVMFKLKVAGAAVACFALVASVAWIHANSHDVTVVVTMTNDPETNQIKVYDANARVLLQTLPTHGKGGVGGNARGIKQLDARSSRSSTTGPIRSPCLRGTATD